MKINRTTSLGSSPVKRSERSGKPATDKFAREIEGQDGLTDPVSGVGPAQGIDALLAVQEVESAIDRDGNASRGRQWGGEILDRLDSIRLGLLSGGISITELKNISVLISTQRASAKDPRLNEILDEIELRARVELAKYEQ